MSDVEAPEPPPMPTLQLHPDQMKEPEPAPKPRPSYGTDAMMVGAPPSRPGGSGDYGASRPHGRYTLSRDEADIAAISGISPAEYQRNKLFMDEMKKNGQLQ
jgi:hypothetical protein